MIKIEESFELFYQTLSRLDENKLKLSDADLEFEIFEELDADNHTFLHEWTVDRLIIGGLLPSSLKQRILNLRESIILVMETKHDIKFYRNDSEWKKIRIEANSIITTIKTFSNNK